MFSIASSQTHDNVFDQIDDIAIGSSLAPMLANHFLGHYENSWLNKCHSPSVHFCRRYADDTFCVFNLKMRHYRFLNF